MQIELGMAMKVKGGLDVLLDAASS